MTTKFIKVAVSERVPKVEKLYHCIFPEGNIFTIPFDKKFGFHEEFTDCSGITHYLIEVPDESESLLKDNCEMKTLIHNSNKLMVQIGGENESLRKENEELRAMLSIVMGKLTRADFELYVNIKELLNKKH